MKNLIWFLILFILGGCATNPNECDPTDPSTSNFFNAAKCSFGGFTRHNEEYKKREMAKAQQRHQSLQQKLAQRQAELDMRLANKQEFTGYLAERGEVDAVNQEAERLEEERLAEERRQEEERRIREKEEAQRKEEEQKKYFGKCYNPSVPALAALCMFFKENTPKLEGGSLNITVKRGSFWPTQVKKFTVKLKGSDQSNSYIEEEKSRGNSFLEGFLSGDYVSFNYLPAGKYLLSIVGYDDIGKDVIFSMESNFHHPGSGNLYCTFNISDKRVDCSSI